LTQHTSTQTPKENLALRANICCMSDHYIQLLMLVVQALALAGLTIYCVETFRMRTAAQQQVKSSMDQLESYSKPCITFWSELRQGDDVILQMHGATGNLVARPDGGSYVMHNLGNGLALNLRYYITRNNPPLDQDPNRWRYVPTVPATAKVTLVETLGHYNQEHEATFEYESIGGRKYRSTITLNHHVITSYRFEEIKT
jgi:hypothetical protein